MNKITLYIVYGLCSREVEILNILNIAIHFMLSNFKNIKYFICWSDPELKP